MARQSKESVIDRYTKAYEANKTNGKSWRETLIEFGLDDCYFKLDLDGLNKVVADRKIRLMVDLQYRALRRNEMDIINLCIQIASRYVPETLQSTQPKTEEIFDLKNVEDVELLKEVGNRNIRMGNDGKWHKVKEILVRQVEDSVIDL